MPRAKKAEEKKTTESGRKRSGRKYENAAALQAAIDKYFAHCEETGELVGEEGLAYHLGVTQTQLGRWYDGEDCPDLQETAQAAFGKIDYLNSIDPRFMDKAMSSRYIFQKKQRRHGGWQDKQEVSGDVKVELTIKDYDEALTK